jgi:hypothetical protein
MKLKAFAATLLALVAYSGWSRAETIQVNDSTGIVVLSTFDCSHLGRGWIPLLHSQGSYLRGAGDQTRDPATITASPGSTGGSNTIEVSNLPRLAVEGQYTWQADSMEQRGTQGLFQWPNGMEGTPMTIAVAGTGDNRPFFPQSR